MVIEGPHRYDARYKLRAMSIATFADGDTTPSIAAMDNSIYKTNNSGATVITDFDDKEVGEFAIIIGDANTKFQNGANLKLLNGALGDNVSYAANDMIRFVCDGSTVYQAGLPSFNS